MGQQLSTASGVSADMILKDLTKDMEKGWVELRHLASQVTDCSWHWKEDSLNLCAGE